MNEEDLLDAVVDLAKWLRIRVHHCRPCRKEDGTWYTPIQGDPGFPDLVLVGSRGILWRELKGPKGQPTTAQDDWLDRLEQVDEDANIWRPADWHSRKIETEMKGIQ